MSNSYNILAPSLHLTADAAIDWFKKNWGIRSNAIEIEGSMDDAIGFRPTVVMTTPDHHLLCIEVSESLYTKTLDSIILDCRNRGLPIKLCVAVPKDPSDPYYSTNLRDARRAGVGILEVDKKSGNLIANPLSQSLTGVRPVGPTSFPTRYRMPLQQAEQQFRDGQPSKACSMVFDELEGSFRRFAEKCKAKSLLTNNVKNIRKGAWARLIREVDDALDRTSPLVKPVGHPLLARIEGMTEFRNDSGHKPSTRAGLIKRDRELRTRFESVVDLLHAFLTATKALKP